MSFAKNIHFQIINPEGVIRVAFIHGLMGFSGNWRKILNLCNELCDAQGIPRFQFLIYDQRGHGRSFKPETGYTPEDYAQDLYQLVQEVGWTDFHLVGHSMGARNAYTFAYLYPQLLKSLIVEDMGPETKSESYIYYEELLNKIPTPFANKELVKEHFQTKFPVAMKYNEPPAVLSAFLQANLEEKENGQWDWKFSKRAILETVRLGHVKDRWHEVASLRMPTLLIRGELSAVLSQDTYEKTLSINPNFTGKVVAGAGHWVHFDRANEFAELIFSHINQHAEDTP